MFAVGFLRMHEYRAIGRTEKEAALGRSNDGERTNLCSDSNGKEAFESGRCCIQSNAATLCPQRRTVHYLKENATLLMRAHRPRFKKVARASLREGKVLYLREFARRTAWNTCKEEAAEFFETTVCPVYFDVGISTNNNGRVVRRYSLFRHILTLYC